MIQVELKAKHYYLIANILFRDSAINSFSLLQRIKDATDGVADDDLVTVTSTTEELLTSYRKLSNQPEGQYSQINAEMVALLTPQIQAGVAANDQEWIDVSIRITAMRATNDEIIQNYIVYGKTQLS
jgi:hypothetical protein